MKKILRLTIILAVIPLSTIIGRFVVLLSVAQAKANGTLAYDNYFYDITQEWLPHYIIYFLAGLVVVAGLLSGLALIVWAIIGTIRWILGKEPIDNSEPFSSF